jgi:hypothetical protein
LKDVTKIDVAGKYLANNSCNYNYRGSAQNFVVVCMVFYNEETVVEAIMATNYCNYHASNIKALFIDKCPENGF